MAFNISFDFDGIKPQLNTLIQYYYKVRPQNAAGGNLHICLDDGNLSLKDIAYCSELCEQKGDSLGLLICDLLLLHSEAELIDMYKNKWK